MAFGEIQLHNVDVLRPVPRSEMHLSHNEDPCSSHGSDGAPFTGITRSSHRGCGVSNYLWSAGCRTREVLQQQEVICVVAAANSCCMGALLCSYRYGGRYVILCIWTLVGRVWKVLVILLLTERESLNRGVYFNTCRTFLYEIKVLCHCKIIAKMSF